MLHADAFASPNRWKWTISRSRRNLMTSFTSGSSESLRMLSYVTRAFCSAARSSVRSAMGSPLTCILEALQGNPEAAVGYTPAV